MAHLTRLDYADAVAREAERLLLRLIWRLHVVNVTDTMAQIEIELPRVWGAPFEDLEPEPWEDDGDYEDDRAA
jgi:hypothetical protein